MSPGAADAAQEAIPARAAVALVAALPRDQAEIIMLRVVAGLEAAMWRGSPTRPRAGCGWPRTEACAGLPAWLNKWRNKMRGPDALHCEIPESAFRRRSGGEHDGPAAGHTSPPTPSPPGASAEVHDLGCTLRLPRRLARC